MKVLAFDTSGDTLSAILLDGERPLAEFDSPHFARHSDILASSLGKLLKNSRTAPREISCIAVGLGPGSFTGLRVGITTAKVLSYAWRKKIVGIPSTQVIAQGVRDWRGRILVILDAKKEQIYTAVYQSDGGRVCIVKEPFLATIKNLSSWIDGPTYFIGDAVDLYRDHLTCFKKFSCVFTGGEQARPKALHLAVEAQHRIKEKKFTDPFLLEPCYVHPRDCNVIKK